MHIRSKSIFLVLFFAIFFASTSVSAQGKNAGPLLCPNSIFPDGNMWDGNLKYTRNQCSQPGATCDVLYFHSTQAFETGICQDGKWQIEGDKTEPVLCPNSVFPNGYMWNGNIEYTTNQCSQDGAECANVYFHESSAFETGLCRGGIWDFERGIKTLLAVNDTINLEVGDVISANVLANDDLGTEPTSLTFEAGTLPSWLTLDTSGNLAGTAPSAGDGSFMYTITDSTGASSTAMVNITATDPDLAVVAADDDYTLLSGETLNQNILDNDQLGNAPTTLSLDRATLPAWATLDDNGNLSGTAASGDWRVVYTITDNDGDADSAEIVISVPAIIQTSTINGRIVTPIGQVLDQVSISVLDNSQNVVATAVSDNNGVFSVEVDAATDVVLVLTKAGFADQVKPYSSPNAAGEIDIDLVMVERGAVISVNTIGETTQTGSSGASVTFDPADFVDASGQALSGPIELTITPVDVSNGASVGAFPGLFAGFPEGQASSVEIISLGVVEFEFTQNGMPVNLAPGTTADVEIPIYVETYQSGVQIQSGDIVPFWSLDEQTGLWTQEGNGTVVASSDSPTGLAMRATVSHFSWWNCDVAATTATVEVTVLGPASGDAIIVANAPGLVNWRGSTVNTTVDVNTTTDPLTIPANIQVCFSATLNYDTGFTSTTDQVCITALPNSSNTLTLGALTEGPLQLGTVPGGVLDLSILEGRLLSPILIVPLTQEQSVQYVIGSGGLPSGLQLDVFNNRATIQGAPDVPGVYNIEVIGTDTDGNSDTVSIALTVLSIALAPPEFDPFDGRFRITIFDGQGAFDVDLNQSNIGGPADTWRLIDPDTALFSNCNLTGILFEIPAEAAFPQGLSLSEAGIISVASTGVVFPPNDFFSSLLICVRAENGNGSDDILIDVQQNAPS